MFKLPGATCKARRGRHQGSDINWSIWIRLEKEVDLGELRYDGSG